MQAGQLRHRLEIQTPVDAQDDNGEVVRTWATVSTVWGEVVPISGNERLKNRQTSADTTHQIRTRYTTLTPKNRIKIGSKYLYVVSAANVDEHGIELLIQAKEEVAV